MYRETFNPNHPLLLERYLELFELQDWKNLPQSQIGDLAFGVAEFWKDRAKFLAVNSEADLLANTPIEGKHTLPGTPAYQRLNG
jgi:hypothetical protein